MLTVADVRIAIEQGDKPRAVEMLQIILAENPSADAWYIAARIAHDEKTTLKYLRRALMIDPDHRRSQMLLQKMGGQKRSAFGHILDELIDVIHEQADKSLLLKRFNPRQQVIVTAIITVFVLFGLIVTTANLFHTMNSTSTLYVPEVAPQARQMTRLNVNMFADQLVANGYALLNMKITNKAGSAYGQTLSFSVPDAKGNWLPVSILVYRDLNALLMDQSNLEKLEATAKVVAQENAVLIYPTALTEREASQLINVFYSLTAKPAS